MQVFMTKGFQRWADREGVTDDALLSAVAEIGRGLVDADLGGHVVKKRIATRGRGKRGSVRTLLAILMDEMAFFIYGFAKNERANISQKELKALRLLASELLSYSDSVLSNAIQAGELKEVDGNG